MVFTLLYTSFVALQVTIRDNDLTEAITRQTNEKVIKMENKLIAAGGKVWEKDAMKRIYLTQEIVNKADLGINFNEKKHKLYFDCVTSKFAGTSATFVRVLNANI